MKGVFETKAKVKDDPKPSILKYLLKFAEDGQISDALTYSINCPFLYMYVKLR